jgi:hypothetical protein
LAKILGVLGSASGHLIPGIADWNGGFHLFQEFQAFDFKSLDTKARVFSKECKSFLVSSSADPASEVFILVTQKSSGGNDVISSATKPFFRANNSGKLDKGGEHRNDSLGKVEAVFGCEEDSLPGGSVALGHVSKSLAEESLRWLGQPFLSRITLPFLSRMHG